MNVKCPIIPSSTLVWKGTFQILLGANKKNVWMKFLIIFKEFIDKIILSKNKLSRFKILEYSEKIEKE